jgi:hypothetical protein
MATDKQIAANQANAQKSTGPKTPQGRANSAGNRRTHGFRASDATIRGEYDEEYDAILADLIHDLKPEDSFERDQVTAMAAADWRCRRAFRFDTGFTDVNLAHLRKTRESIHYPDDPALSDRDLWSDPDFLGRRENRLLGETFDKCGHTLLRNANYIARFRRYYDNAYSKLLIRQESRRRSETRNGQQA